MIDEPIINWLPNGDVEILHPDGKRRVSHFPPEHWGENNLIDPQEEQGQQGTQEGQVNNTNA